MTTISSTKDTLALDSDAPRLDVGKWLQTQVFSTIWHTLFAIILVMVNLWVIQAAFQAEPIALSFNFAPQGQPTTLGNLILTLTDGALLTSVMVILWLVGAGAVIYGAIRHHWPPVIQWLKDSLYTGFFGSLMSLFLLIVIVFAIRGLLGWGVFGAEFRSDPETVAVLKDMTPGAVWGIVGANTKLFAVGRYPNVALWRVWFSLAVVFVLAVLSTFAWNFGSPLQRYRKPIFYGWLASIPLTYAILHGMPGVASGAFRTVGTNLWGGFLLTVVLSVTAIVISFPIGLLLALGRRSQSRGVPYMWLWGVFLLGLYWLFGNFPAETTQFNLPVIFLDPPILSFTLSPMGYAALQAVIVVGLFWAVGHYLQGNLIKTFCVGYIEMIRGVPLITVLFMANIMLPIFLPKGFEVDNLLRVVVGLIMFAAAYLAENVRGGLQSIPKGQYEAAMAVGLSTTQSMRFIILPQALRAVIPAIVGQFISLFKDTSLVAIIGLFDLLKIAQTVVAQPDWLGLQRETFAFVALIYWVFSFAMSTSSRRLERKLGVGSN